MYRQITPNHHRLSTILLPSLVPTLCLCNKTKITGDLYPNAPIANNSLLSKVKVDFWDNHPSIAGTRVDDNQ